MSARRAPSHTPSPAADARRYFDHRRATGAAVEMLVGAELEVLWLSAAALSQGARQGPFAFSADRLILPSRLEEDQLRAFLDATEAAPGVWTMTAAGKAWLVHAEPITPPETARAWLLTWRPAASPGGRLWADVGGALKLTRAETRMLMLLLDGLSVEDAARRQSVSVETARTHVRRIYAKLGVSNRGQLFTAVLPYRWG